MDFQFYFKKMTSSETLKELATRKIKDKVDKFLDYSSKVHVTFFQDGNQKHIQCTISGINGPQVYAIGSSDSMFNAIDIIVQKLEAQLQRRKTKLKNRHKRRRLDFYPGDSLRFLRQDSLMDQPFLEPIDAADIIKFEAAYRPYRARFAH